MNELSLGSLRIERTMTVKEIAEALGMAEITIRKKAVELFPDCVKNGVATRLTERQVTQLKQSLTPRNLISKYKVDSATTDLEMFQNVQKCMQWLSMKNAELQAEIERQKQELVLQQPKVDTYNRIANSTGLKTMQEVAKILKIGSNTLFSVLRDKGVFYRSNGVNLPQEKYIKQGLFEVKEEPYKRDNKDFVYTRVFATAKGLLWLEKQIDTQK